MMRPRMRLAFGVAVTAVLVGAAIAMAVVSKAGDSHGAQGVVRSGLAKNEVAGVESRDEGSDKGGLPTGDDPNAAAEEEYQLRAYPADEIPFSATLNSIQAWKNVKAKGVGNGKNTPSQWTL